MVSVAKTRKGQPNEQKTRKGRVSYYQMLIMLYGVQQKIKTEMITRVILTVLMRARPSVPTVTRRIPSCCPTA